MSIQFSLGKRLLRAAVSLGFLGCLIAAETVSSQAATSESSVVASQALMRAGGSTPSFCGSPCAKLNAASSLGDALRFNTSDSMLTEQREVGLPAEFGVAFEDDDSIEMLRIDIQERTSGMDRVELRPRIVSKAASHTRPNISPPLLV
jgi:hypothetical protein